LTQKFTDVAVRMVIFLAAIFALNKQAKRLVTKIIRDRRYLQTNKRFWRLIETYSKFEGKLIRFMSFFMIFNGLFFSFIVPLTGFNKTRLPLDFFIPFLLVEGNWVNWGVNYVYQLILIVCLICLVNAHIGITILVISHACFKIETVLISIKRFGDSFEENTKNIKYWRIWNHSIIDNRMKRVVDETNDIMQYTKMAQKFIAMPNCADTLIICFTICTSAYAARHNWFASALCVAIILTSMVQLAIYNFAGQIMLDKLNALVFSVYNTPWYNLNYRKQKDICFILLATQNMRGLKGIFNNLCNATFYQVSLLVNFSFLARTLI
jgi:7tm Odorant receptor